MRKSLLYIVLAATLAAALATALTLPAAATEPSDTNVTVPTVSVPSTPVTDIQIPTVTVPTVPTTPTVPTVPTVPGSGTTQRSSHGRALRALRRRVPSRVGRALLEEAVKQTADPSRAREVLTPCPPLLSGEGERWTVCVLKRLPTRRTGHPPVGGPGHCSAPPHPAA